MYRLNSALRTLFVICTLAFTAVAQTGGANIGGGGIQWTGGDLNITNSTQSSLGTPAFTSAIAGGSQPHTNVSTDLGLSYIISLLTNGMPLTGF